MTRGIDTDGECAVPTLWYENLTPSTDRVIVTDGLATIEATMPMGLADTRKVTPRASLLSDEVC